MRVDEAAGAKPELGGDLAAGVTTLSLNQVVAFQKYAKYVLPIDGTVYWIKTADAPREFKGSLHYATNQQQKEDGTEAQNAVVFTSLEAIDDLNRIDADTLYIASIGTLRAAFNSRGSFYRQADLYHYRGDATYPALFDVLVDDPLALITRVVVSNSLPVWLTLGPVGVPVYPSFLVAPNLRPPYIAVHIEPGQTEAIQAVPWKTPVFKTAGYVAPDYWSPDYTQDVLQFPLEVPDSVHNQLTRDRVRCTLYGLRNEEALAFFDGVLAYSANTDIIGLMNTPIVRDEKRTQTELGALALKKTVEFEVSYYQSRVYNVAVSLIKSALVQFYVPGA